MYRLHPSWEAVRELVASGRIGRLRAVQSWFSYFNDDPDEHPQRRRARRRRAVRHRLLLRSTCRGCCSSGEPTRIEASVTRDATGTDVLTSAILEFDDGVATFTCSTRAEPDQRVHIYGTEGRISIGIPFNIPPDRPTEVVRHVGRRSAGQPGHGDAHVRDRRIRTRSRRSGSRARCSTASRCRSRPRTRSGTCG